MKLVSKGTRITALINQMGLRGMGVEVGVQKGYFSRKLLEDTSLRRLYSVDSWCSFSSEEYPDYGNVSWWKHIIFYCQTRFKLIRFRGRSVILHMTSIEASLLFEDASLDFIYIDANHTYQAVKKDLNAWYPKVKPGGLISGDDYLDGKLKFGTFGVKKAVDEFVKEHRLTLNLFESHTEFPLWYVVKEDG